MSLEQGLRISLFGALRDDLCPGAWLEMVDDDELWEALRKCQPQLDPFSLLGALDVALYHQHDERFRTFAEEAVTKLTAEQFPDALGFDHYQLFPFLAQLALDRINLSNDGTLRAPFWKRMCACMQASMVVHLLTGLNVNFDELCKQLEVNLSLSGRYANLIDLRREPMYLSIELSPPALGREVLRRLFQLEGRHQAAGRAIPQSDAIQEAFVRFTQTTPPLSLLFPGPLEGHHRPEESNVLAQETKDELIKLPGDQLLSKMVSFSQVLHLDEETRSLLREVISRNHPGNTDLPPEERLLHLAHAGIVAAAERDRELAQVIADGVLALGSALHEEATLSQALQGLLIAGTAFEDEAAWADWLKEQLAALAGLLPAGKATVRLYDALQALKRITKLDLRITSKAEALASAASPSLK